MKWFSVATEGATTDGRTISRKWIEEMAKNFNRAKYGARIWLEHMRGLFADGPFAALGDVTAVKAEEVDGKLTLFVQLDPTDQLKEMNKNRQKIYTSIEVDPDFADTGEAYLVGLAVTDSPASLGTEMLQFSQQQAANSPLNNRKLRPENLFSVAVETAFDFSEDNSDDKKSLLETIKEFFSKTVEQGQSDFSQFRADLKSTLEMLASRFNTLESDLSARPSADAFNSLKTDHEKLQKEFKELCAKLDKQPDTPNRAPATGGPAAELTDC